MLEITRSAVMEQKEIDELEKQLNKKFVEVVERLDKPVRKDGTLVSNAIWVHRFE